MRARLIGSIGLLAIACTSVESPRDGATPDDTSRDAPLVDTNILAGASPDDVPCGPDVTAALGFDPCLHWVDCRSHGDDGDWAATFSNGTCDGARCVFADAPVLTPCATYCYRSGPMGRCVNPGPTAP